MRLLSFLLLFPLAIHQQTAEQRHLLGTVTDAHGRVLYRVETSFRTVQAALTRHGHSAVLFYNPHQRLVARYDVGMPANLPIRLTNNTLFFQPTPDRLYTLALGPALPLMLCVAPADCYARE